MDFLKALWPTPYKIKERDFASFIVQLVVFVVICAVVGLAIGICSAIPILGIIFWIVGGLLELYSVIGVVLCILQYLGALK